MYLLRQQLSHPSCTEKENLLACKKHLVLSFCYLHELTKYVYNSNCFVTSHSYVLHSLVAPSFSIVIT